MRKFEEFFYLVASLRSFTRGQVTKKIKRKIGDSVKNNRTLTVNQLARFATSLGKNTTANKLKEVLRVLEPQIHGRRGNRTDAIDLGEFVDTYRDVVMNKRQLRQNIGKILSKAD